MISDDANDVTKALAAFGAPSIRYHSFGQGQVRPSSVVLPQRDVAAAPTPRAAAANPRPAPIPQQAAPSPRPAPNPQQAAPSPRQAGPSPRQDEPPVAHEPRPPTPMPPVPAFRRTLDPAAVAPRPLPATQFPSHPTPLGALVRAPAFMAQPAPAPIHHAPPPALHAALARASHAPPPAFAEAPPQRRQEPPAAASAPPRAAVPAFQPSTASPRRQTLADIFALLANAPASDPAPQWGSAHRS